MINIRYLKSLTAFNFLKQEIDTFPLDAAPEKLAGQRRVHCRIFLPPYKHEPWRLPWICDEDGDLFCHERCEGDEVEASQDLSISLIVLDEPSEAGGPCEGSFGTPSTRH
jgi:hypothetical protein